MGTTGTTRTTTPTWAGWAGITFAVLFVAGMILLNTPDSDASVAEWQEHFDDSGNRTLAVLHGYLWALAGVAFLIFASGLRERLRAAEGADWVAVLAWGSGIAFVAMLFVAAAATTAVAGGIEFGDLQTEGAGEFARWIEQVGFASLLLFGMFAGGTFVASSSLAGRRAGLLPGWLAISGYVVAVVVAVLGVVFFPIALLVLWVVAVSVVLLRVQATTPSLAGG